mgnify:CR=1 FL=1
MSKDNGKLIWQDECLCSRAGCILALAPEHGVTVRVVAREGEEKSPGVRIPEGSMILRVEYGSSDQLSVFMEAVTDFQTLVRRN